MLTALPSFTLCARADEVNALVADFGSHSVKVGYAGEDTPKAVFPSLFGEVEGETRPLRSVRAGAQKGGGEDGDAEMEDAGEAGGKAANGAAGGGKAGEGSRRHLRVGAEGVGYRRDHMEVKPLVEEGAVRDYDAQEAFWEYIYDDRLNMDPREHPVMLAEPNDCSAADRERQVQLLFEKYSAPAVFLAKDAVLSAFSIGRPTGLVVDVGHSGSKTAAVHDGYVLQKSVRRGVLGGRVLAEGMLAATEARGIPVRPRYTFKKVDKGDGEWEVQDCDAPHTSESYHRMVVGGIAADMVESTCRVSETPFDWEGSANIPAAAHELPDGKEVPVGAERFQIPEGLFQPSALATYAPKEPAEGSVWGSLGEAQGLAEQVMASLGSVDVDLRKELLASIVLTGGGSMLPNIRERLEREVSALAPGVAKVKVISSLTSVERRFSTWIGGSILASLGSFQQMWMSKEEYEEHGASLIHRKAP